MTEPDYTYDSEHNFPSIFFIVPRKGGRLIGHQCAGMSCGQRQIEGDVVKLTDFDRRLAPWDSLIPHWNYTCCEGKIKIGGLAFNGTYSHKEVGLIDYCWLQIKADTGWDWEPAAPTSEQISELGLEEWERHSVEAWEWVRITETPIDFEGEYPNTRITKPYDHLVGQVVVLVYPNCD